MAAAREDIGTTKRKPLTPTQRLALFEREKGLCCICGNKIFGRFIDEHKRALGLGGSNATSNRGVAHPKCASIKTLTEDIPRIVKAKAQKKAAHGIKSERRAQIPRPPKAGNPPSNKLQVPGPRALFVKVAAELVLALDKKRNVGA